MQYLDYSQWCALLDRDLWCYSWKPLFSRLEVTSLQYFFFKSIHHYWFIILYKYIKDSLDGRSSITWIFLNRFLPRKLLHRKKLQSKLLSYNLLSNSTLLYFFPIGNTTPQAKSGVSVTVILPLSQRHTNASNCAVTIETTLSFTFVLFYFATFYIIF